MAVGDLLIKQPDLGLVVVVVAGMYTHTAAVPATQDKDMKVVQEYGKDLAKPVVVAEADLLELGNKAMVMQVAPEVLALPCWDLV